MPQIEDTPENFKICMQKNCNTCPSFPRGKGEGLYCARGPSQLPIEKNGCNCPECPLWIDAGLSQMYYCARSR